MAVTDPLLQAYFRESSAWEAHRERWRRRSVVTAWAVAFVAAGCCLALAAALSLLMPLKRVEPFVIRVDNSTGVVDVAPTAVIGTDLPESVTRYFLTHYVTTCERFNFATAESDYEECGAFHAPVRNQQWLALWTRSNPQSPLNRFKDGTQVRAQVSSVAFFKRGSGVSDLAQVRYLRSTQHAGDGVPEETTHWIATVQYAYATPPAEPRIRRWNPLGFKIVDFHSEPEVLSEGAPATLAHSTAVNGASQ